jgi:hypothetical protein
MTSPREGPGPELRADYAERAGNITDLDNSCSENILALLWELEL